MRDYNLIRYFAKKMGLKPKNDKKHLYCCFPYDENAFLTGNFYFEHGQSRLAVFDLTDIYEAYGKNKFSTYDKFLDAFLEQAEIFEKFTDDNGHTYARNDLLANRFFENTVSQALMNASIAIISLNKLLGRKAEVLKESDWRSLHRMYLKKKKLIYGGMSAAGLALAVGCFVIEAVTNANNLPLLALMLVAALSLIGALFCLFKFLFYKRHLKKAIREAIK